MSVSHICMSLLIINAITAMPYSFKQGKDDVVFQWKTLDYKWPNDYMKQQYLDAGKYVVENNLITGIKVFDGNVYVTVPRWKPGVPSTLNKVVTNSANESLLEPYPSWEMQTVGDCNAFQYVQSMEIDPNTGFMWIIDVGRVHLLHDQPINMCPAKLVIYDLKNNVVKRMYEFPEIVASRDSNFLNDIVIDYMNGVASFAYMSDTYDSKLYVYDYIRNTSYFFQDPTFDVESGTETIVIGNNSITTQVKINGLAMSADFRYLYYCALNGYNLYRVSTELLRNKLSDFSAEFVGRKVDLSGGMVFSDASLYYGALTMNAVYKLTTGHSDNNQFVEEQVLANSTTLRWVDTFAIDDRQNLWFVANGLDLFFNGRMDFSKTNMYIWKVHIGENSYLTSANNSTLKYSSYLFGK